MRPPPRSDLPPREIPEDVQRRYAELQAEIQRLDVSPQTRVGESRQERYARQQRLRQYRRELDKMARYPMARRSRTSPTTVLAMVGIALLLCVLSFGGGALLTGILNRPVDISSVANPFWQAMETQQYDVAHGYLDPRSENLQDFTNTARKADNDMGAIDKVTPASQSKTGAGVSFASATYLVHRTGGTLFKSATYKITLNFNYNANSGFGSNQWTIIDIGSLLTDPQPSS